MSTEYCNARYVSDPEFRQRRIAASLAYQQRVRQDSVKSEAHRAARREYERAWRKAREAAHRSRPAPTANGRIPA
jgi:hypothetical protein